MYDERMVMPMREELTSLGVTELRTAGEVDEFFGDRTGTALLVVNSVCGCAAGMARPGLRMALEGANRPDRLATVFAGQDAEATAQARHHFGHVPPSSPSFALFRDGELAHFVPRHAIEGRRAEDVAADLRAAFAEHCS